MFKSEIWKDGNAKKKIFFQKRLKPNYRKRAKCHNDTIQSCFLVLKNIGTGSACFEEFYLFWYCSKSIF